MISSNPLSGSQLAFFVCPCNPHKSSFRGVSTMLHQFMSSLQIRELKRLLTDIATVCMQILTTYFI